MTERPTLGTAVALWLIAIVVAVFAVTTALGATEWWQFATAIIAASGSVVLVTAGARFARKH